MLYRTILVFSLLASGLQTFSQHIGEFDGLIHKDTSLHSLLDFFQNGEVHGHVRNYFMTTVNHGDLKDYWTNAIGGAIKYETAEWYGLQLGIKGTFSHQAFSSDLNERDNLVNKSAKWEKELYDINRPYETNDLDQLEEFYIRANVGKSHIEVGKIDVNEGPLFLRRDGRMKPFVYRGIWGEWKEFKNQKITFGLINGVSPRGMIEWFSLNEAIGLLNNGYQPNGTKAQYHEKSEIKYILGTAYEIESKAGLKVQLWNYYFQNMSNINWLQADWKKNHFIAGLQLAHQRPLAKQKLLPYQERYMQPDEKANVINVLAGIQNKSEEVSVTANYFHSFGTGRFLFPKELGRENFYASDARSWVEGYGSANVYMIKFSYKPSQINHINTAFDARLSRVETPSVGNQLNKYGIGSYKQVSLDFSVKFPKKLKGAIFRLLYITRYSDKMNLASEANKFYASHFHHFNFITNINF